MKRREDRLGIVARAARLAFVSFLVTAMMGLVNYQTQLVFASSTVEWNWSWEVTANEATREYNIKHNGVQVIKDVKIPFIYVVYPNDQNIVDVLGISSISRLDHGPHEHDAQTSLTTGKMIHTIFRVGASCPADPNNHPFYGCYKYGQQDFFYDSHVDPTHPLPPRFKHYLIIYGEGFPDRGGQPIYNVWWRVDTDMPNTYPGNDIFRHRTGTTTWTPIDKEQEFFDDFSGGAEWQTYDSAAGDNLSIDPRTFDIARFVVLLQNPNELHPPASNPWPAANWANMQDVNREDTVYWYRGQAGGCTVTSTCSVGPSVNLNGGL